MLSLVITAAVGIELKYPPTIQHYTYLLQDIKTENMLQYFEEIVARIDKGRFNDYFRTQKWWGFGSLRCWSFQGKSFIVFSQRLLLLLF